MASTEALKKTEEALSGHSCSWCGPQQNANIQTVATLIDATWNEAVGKARAYVRGKNQNFIQVQIERLARRP